MQRLIRKLKRVKKLPKYLYYLLSSFYLITFLFFLKSMINLKGIETLFRVIIIIFFLLYFLLYLNSGLLNLISRKYKKNYFWAFFTIIFIVFLGVSSYYINFIYAELGRTIESDKITYTTNLVTLKDTKFNKSIIIGQINDQEDIEGFILAKKLYKKEKLTNQVKDYGSYILMLKELLAGKIGAVFMPSNFASRYKNEEGFENIEFETKIIKKYSEERKNENPVPLSSKDFSEPLTFLIMGVDSTKDGLDAQAAFNGDTIMVIAINPHNLKTTMLSIPRDTYVPIACHRNRYAKINSSAAHSTNCVINTVSNLLDIKIDYYVKINFRGVVDLVDAIGGIKVDVQKPDYKWHDILKINCRGKFCEQNSYRQTGKKDIIYIEPGWQKLNGEQALAYSRCRHMYARGDFDRIKHQQQVVEALFQKLLSFSSLSDFQDILKAISKNMITNMDRDKILSGYAVAKKMLSNVLKGNDFITITKPYLETYSLRTYVEANQMYTSAAGYYLDSLKDIQDELKETLDLKASKVIKTLDFSVNSKYVLAIPGKGKKSQKSSFLLPNFVGQTVSEAEKYGKDNNIEITIAYVDPDSPYYNDNVLVGLICNQSVHEDVHLTMVKKLTVYVKNSEKANNEKVNEEDNTNIEAKEDFNIIESLIN